MSFGIPLRKGAGPVTGETDAPASGVLVSVLMAVYNTPPPLLDQAIRSIRAQSLTSFEFVILDDGSSDLSTRAMLLEHAAAEPRIRLLWEPHRGLTRTLNQGLKIARGEWIARQDADDWSEPSRLERQLALLKANPACGLCGTGAWLHQHNGRPLWPIILPESNGQILQAFPQRNPFVHGSVMFSKTAARAAGGYREEFPCSQDYDFFWRLTEATGAANCREPLYHYRYTSGAVSVRRAMEQELAHRAARLLAAAREAGTAENVETALSLAQREMEQFGSPLRAALKQADHRMLAGDYLGAGRVFAGLLVDHLRSSVAWGKLARWILFSLPPLRRSCFR